MSESAQNAASAGERVYVLDGPRLQSAVEDAPQRALLAEVREQGPIITLPMPNGTFERFAVTKTSVSAEQSSSLQLYAGVGLDRKDLTASIERSDDGWSAMVLSAEGMTFISPVIQGQRDLYMSAAKSDAARAQRFRCLVEGSSDRGQTTGAERRLPSSFGGSSRVYRLAMAATGEYTNFFRRAADTDAQAKARAKIEIERLVARLNQVYGRELAIQFSLVAREGDIIYTDTANDPYTNEDADALLDENQTNLDSIIGRNNYDIGHVVGTGGGGLATLRATCVGSSKARGETGSSSPTSDSFYIDYVAHEIGHQFGGNHTFNGTTGSCGGGNRNASTAYEPGSGTTIMAYAGICGSEDITRNSSDYFHAISIDEIIAHITDGGACVTATANGNRAPTVALAGPARVLAPGGTPFELRATANDPDGDTVLYSWEQFDLGDASPPSDDSRGILRPMFRSQMSIASQRAFPSIANVVGAIPPIVSFESLPREAPAVSFRVLARDQRGGFAFQDATVALVRTAGPFVITSPTAASTWRSGQTQTVTWSAANTDQPPLLATNVSIELSTDGGATFTTLLASTPNDNSETITVPAVASPRRAVVRVSGVGQVFFAVTPSFAVNP
jgi:hypothetical protein